MPSWLRKLFGRPEPKADEGPALSEAAVSIVREITQLDAKQLAAMMAAVRTSSGVRFWDSEKNAYAIAAEIVRALLKSEGVEPNSLAEREFAMLVRRVVARSEVVHHINTFSPSTDRDVSRSVVSRER